MTIIDDIGWHLSVLLEESFQDNKEDPVKSQTAFLNIARGALCIDARASSMSSPILVWQRLGVAGEILVYETWCRGI